VARESTVRAEVTFLGELSGRWVRLAAIGVGAFGLGELFARRLVLALPCLGLAAVLLRLRRGDGSRRA
jgi:hypothetical protein